MGDVGTAGLLRPTDDEVGEPACRRERPPDLEARGEPLLEAEVGDLPALRNLPSRDEGVGEDGPRRDLGEPPAPVGDPTLEDEDGTSTRSRGVGR